MSGALRIAACDLNGQARGKRLPADYAQKLAEGAARMPFSALNIDVTGADIEGSPLVFESGDADGMLLPTGRGPVPMPWLPGAPTLHPMVMYHDADTPFAGDPRHALATVLGRYAAQGWEVIAATEMEFYLVADTPEGPVPATPPGHSAPPSGEAILSLDALDAFEGFFTDLYTGAEAMGIPAQAAISESGHGQFEINLTHRSAMDAADDCWLFKLLVRGMARRHGMAATFMAKPYPEEAGNGLHLHFSVLSAECRNIFDDGSAEGSDVLRRAVAGCLAAMPASTLIFAPHANSYARFVDGAHAPTAAGWGYENRTAAIRIPGGAPEARRIEHRLAGGDTCPYLIFAAILGAALIGIEDQAIPPKPITGNAYGANLPRLAPDWETAIDRFATDPLIARLFAPQLIENLVLTKRQELARFGTLDPDALTRLTWESV